MLVLGEGLLDAKRQDRLLDLALDRQLVAEQEVLGDLLGDGRGALRAAGCDSSRSRLVNERAQDAEHVDARVVVEVLVLGRDEGCFTRSGIASIGTKIRRSGAYSASSRPSAAWTRVTVGGW